MMDNFHVCETDFIIVTSVMNSLKLLETDLTGRDEK